MVVTGGKGVEGEAQGMKAGCERMESQGETWAQEGAAGVSRMGFGSVRWQRDRSASGRDLLRAGRGGTVVQMMGQSPL